MTRPMMTALGAALLTQEDGSSRSERLARGETSVEDVSEML